jgi:hypothetical protein
MHSNNVGASLANRKQTNFKEGSYSVRIGNSFQGELRVGINKARLTRDKPYHTENLVKNLKGSDNIRLSQAKDNKDSNLRPTNAKHQHQEPSACHLSQLIVLLIVSSSLP